MPPLVTSELPARREALAAARDSARERLLAPLYTLLFLEVRSHLLRLPLLLALLKLLLTLLTLLTLLGKLLLTQAGRQAGLGRRRALARLYRNCLSGHGEKPPRLSNK